MKKKLICNKIRCKQCGDIIESLHVHELKYCSCKKVAVDGGLEYAKRIFPSGTNPEDYIEELSQWEKIIST